MKILIAGLMIAVTMVTGQCQQFDEICPDCENEYELISAVEWECKYCGKENIDATYKCNTCNYTITYTFDKMY